jgi:hypothetical protein
MNSFDFIRSLRYIILDHEASSYQDSLDTDDLEITDPVWKGISPIYKSMSYEQKTAFLKFIRLVRVNTLSEVLGILDGSSYLSDERVTFTLKAGDEVINGDLQDIFLASEEEI